jgi:ubiquinone/menaquinone biosynthesis C-methylase UbiE
VLSHHHGRWYHQKQQQAQKKLQDQEGVTLQQSTAESLPLQASSANIVTCTRAFHFFRDKSQALQEIK